SGPPGRRALAEIAGEVTPYVAPYAQWRGAAAADTLPLAVEIDGLRLHGRIADAWPQGIARLRFGAPNGPSWLRNCLDWLLARAAGVELPFVEFHDIEGDIGPHTRNALSREDAIEALRALLALRRDGLQRPLPFAPYSGWELF